MPCAEITFRTECAADAIAAMRQAYPEMLIGAGSVVTNDQGDQAIEAGVDNYTGGANGDAFVLKINSDFLSREGPRI